MAGFPVEAGFVVMVFTTTRSFRSWTGNDSVDVFGSVVSSVPRPAMVTLFTILAGVPVPVGIANTSATIVNARVPTSTVMLSGLAAVVSIADAGIVTTSVPVLEVAVIIRSPSGMSSDRVTPDAGDGPSFRAVIV